MPWLVAQRRGNGRGEGVGRDADADAAALPGWSSLVDGGFHIEPDLPLS
jgi:hypothetical protein